MADLEWRTDHWREDQRSGRPVIGGVIFTSSGAILEEVMVARNKNHKEMQGGVSCELLVTAVRRSNGNSA